MSRFLPLFLVGGFLLVGFATGCAGAGRCAMWVDVYSGEPVRFTDVVEDLGAVDVVYLGERHTIDRHHEIQKRIVTELIERGHEVVLGLEQMEAYYQPALDRYNRGELTFAQLAEETDWEQRWSNYEDYRPIVEAVHAAGGEVLALNARRETVRAVARQGIAGLDAATRVELPDEVDLTDAMYEEHLKAIMMVHAHAQPEMVRRMYEAQVARDEMMAAELAAYLRMPADAERIVVVLCGAGHVSQRMGIPQRLRRRMPLVQDRIVVMSESGDVELSERMQAMAREIEITHEQLRILDVPIADYLHVVSLGVR